MGARSAGCEPGGEANVGPARTELVIPSVDASAGVARAASSKAILLRQPSQQYSTFQVYVGTFLVTSYLMSFVTVRVPAAQPGCHSVRWIIVCGPNRQSRKPQCSLLQLQSQSAG